MHLFGFFTFIVVQLRTVNLRFALLLTQTNVALFQYLALKPRRFSPSDEIMVVYGELAIAIDTLRQQI